MRKWSYVARQLELLALRNHPKIVDAVTHQVHVDLLRDLLVKIQELVEGPYGSRLENTRAAKPTRVG